MSGGDTLVNILMNLFLGITLLALSVAVLIGMWLFVKWAFFSKRKLDDSDSVLQLIDQLGDSVSFNARRSEDAYDVILKRLEEIVAYEKGLSSGISEGLSILISNSKETLEKVSALSSKETTPTASGNYDDFFSVKLVSYPEGKKIGAIKVVRCLTGLGLIEAKAFVESLPRVLLERASQKELTDAKNDFGYIGATIEITKIDRPEKVLLG